MRAGWALLRRRDFGLLWTGGLISETGDWLLLAGLLGDVVGVVAVLNGQAAIYLLAGTTAWLTLGRPLRSGRYPRTSKRVRMPLA